MFTTVRLNFLWEKYSKDLAEIAQQRERNAVGIVEIICKEASLKAQAILAKSLDSNLVPEEITKDLHKSFVLNLFRVFIVSDPSGNNSAVQWLIKCYLKENSNLLLEDLGEKTSETLTWFAQFKHRLPEKQRSIYSYGGIAEIYSTIASFIGDENQNISGKQSRKRDQVEVLAQTQVLGEWHSKSKEGKDIYAKAISPQSRLSAEWWGLGTRWCTSAQKNNYFDQYNDDAPLIILNLRKDKKLRKFQLWVTNNSIHFMDEADERLDKDKIKEYWSVLKPVIEWSLAINPAAIELVPPEFITRSMCEDVLLTSILDNKRLGKRNSSHGNLFQSIPTNLLEPELCKLIIDENANTFFYMPNHLKSRKLFLQAIKNTISPFSFVPDEIFEEYGSEELLEWLAINNPRIIGYLEKFQNQALIDTAIANSNTNSNSISLHEIRKDLITAEVCLWAVKEKRASIRNIPEKMYTPEIYTAHIHNYPHCITEIPIEYQTNSLWLHVLEHSYFSREDIPSNLLSQEFINSMYERDILYKYIHLIDKAMISYEICLNIVEHGIGLHYVPPKFRDYTVCLLGVKNHDSSLFYVPPSVIDRDICWAAVERDGAQLEHVPDKYIDAEICRFACEHTGWALCFVPDRLKTKELCKTALGKVSEWMEEGSKSLLRDIPKELWDTEILELAAQCPDSFELLPEKFRTSYVYALQVINDTEYLEQVPTNLKQDVQDMLDKWQREEEKLRKPSVKWNQSLLYDLSDMIDQSVKEECSIIENHTGSPLR